MQPPPNVQYNPFNQPKPPTGKFSWDVMGDSLEIIKAYPWLFVAFTFICGIGITAISQIANIPFQMVIMGGGVDPNNLAPLFIGFGLAMLLSMLLQIVGMALLFGGLMNMGARFMQTRVVELTDGFSVINKVIKISGGILLPYLFNLPIGILYLAIIGPQFLSIISSPEPSSERLFGLIFSTMGVAIFSSVVSLIIYTLMSFIVPAMVIENASPIEAAKKSFNAVKANFGPMLLMNIAFWVMLTISAFCCYIPLLFTVPWYANALLIQYANISRIDLTGKFKPEDYSPYPREVFREGEMPPPPTTPEPEPPAPPPTSQ